MPKALKILGLLIITFSFTSCIELVEEIKINSDLSGKYHLYLKHNGLGFLFNSMPQNLDLTKLDNALQRFEKQKGISNLSSVINLKKGQFSVRFDFSDAKSLTRAFYAGLGTQKRFYHKSFLKVNKAKIKRPNLTPYLVKYAEINGFLDQLPSEKILDFVQYRYKIISFNKIESAQPGSPDNSGNQYEYNQLYPSASLLLHKQSTKSIIRLKK